VQSLLIILDQDSAIKIFSRVDKPKTKLNLEPSLTFFHSNNLQNTPVLAEACNR
jgi:hypothetical protein